MDPPKKKIVLNSLQGVLRVKRRKKKKVCILLERERERESWKCCQ